MLQKDLLLPWRIVLQNVLPGPELQRQAPAQARDTAMEYLHSYGLAGFEHAGPRMLQGGMRQRVALILTLINDPDIILLDEPFFCAGLPDLPVSGRGPDGGGGKLSQDCRPGHARH